MFSFEEGLVKLEGRMTKKLERNTYLIKVDEDILGIDFSNTIVVYIFRSGNYQLNSGGWRNNGIKARFNKYSPVTVIQKDQVWYIGDYIFSDGAIFNNKGELLSNLRKNIPLDPLKDMIDKYVNGFVEHVKENGLYVNNEVESEWAVVELVTGKNPLRPDTGDCWACYFGCDALDDLKEPMGVDHLMRHIKESYYVPSLLLKALKCKYGVFAMAMWNDIEQKNRNGDTKLLKSILKQYFRKRRSALRDLLEVDSFKR